MQFHRKQTRKEEKKKNNHFYSLNEMETKQANFFHPDYFLYGPK